MQTLQTAAGILEALRPMIEAAVVRHTPGEYGVDAVILAHRVRWSDELCHDPSGNHLRSETARQFLQDLGWTSYGFPNEEHIRALVAARCAVEYAMLVSNTSWVSNDVAALLEPYRQS